MSKNAILHEMKLLFTWDKAALCMEQSITLGQEEGKNKEEEAAHIGENIA